MKPKKIFRPHFNCQKKYFDLMTHKVHNNILGRQNLPLRWENIWPLAPLALPSMIVELILYLPRALPDITSSPEVQQIFKIQTVQKPDIFQPNARLLKI